MKVVLEEKTGFGEVLTPFFRGLLPEVLNLQATSFMQSFKWKVLSMNNR